MKTERLNLQFAERLARLAVLAALLTATGCTNNFLRSVGSNASNSSTVIANAPGSFNNTSGGLLTVVRAQKDNFDPTGTVALIGDGSGGMGQYCTAKTAGAGSTGASTCTCSFSFTSNGTAQSFEVDTTYRESNLLRCPSATIPSDVATVTISVHMTAIDAFSNSVKFSVNAGSTFSSASAESFAPVQRTQCRDIVTANYLFDSAVYDPFISDDPRYSYPLNFYTTNIGRTMAYYAGALGGAGITAPIGWNCPVQQTDQPIVLDPYSGTPTTIRNGLNFKIFSQVVNSFSSKMIYPPGPGWNRHDFVVARERSGVFTLPVNAYVFPGQFTVSSGSGIPPLGYAASPIITAGGESCPDTSVSIPSGYHWAKIWLFRAQLAQRTFPTSTKLGQLGEIACNPGRWDGGNPAAGTIDDFVFSSCRGNSQAFNYLVSAFPNVNARVSLSTGECFTVGVAQRTDPLLDPSTTLGLNFRADNWIPSNGDPKLFCKNDVTQTCNVGGDPRDTSTPQAVGTIDQLSNGALRYDYLFVVTPPGVTRTQMDESDPNNLHAIYTPVRFELLDDCKSNDPNSPLFAGDCNPTRMIKYKLKKNEVGAGGNNTDGTPGDFPMCVLQKD